MLAAPCGMKGQEERGAGSNLGPGRRNVPVVGHEENTPHYGGCHSGVGWSLHAVLEGSSLSIPPENAWCPKAARRGQAFKRLLCCWGAGQGLAATGPLQPIDCKGVESQPDSSHIGYLSYLWQVCLCFQKVPFSSHPLVPEQPVLQDPHPTSLLVLAQVNIMADQHPGNGPLSFARNGWTEGKG